MAYSYSDKEIIAAFRSQSIEEASKAIEILYRDDNLREQSILAIESNIFPPFVTLKDNVYDIFEQSIRHLRIEIVKNRFSTEQTIGAFIIGTCVDICTSDLQIIKAVESYTTESPILTKGSLWAIDILYRDKNLKKDLLKLMRKSLFPPFDSDIEIKETIFTDSIKKTVKKIQERTFDKSKTVRECIYGVCYNECRDYNKKKKSKSMRMTTSLEEDVYSIISPEKQPDSLFEKKEEQAVVNRIMSQMDKTCRDFLKKRFHEDKSNAQIAKEMNVSIITVNNNYAKRCYPRLRELLKKDRKASEVFGDWKYFKALKDK